MHLDRMATVTDAARRWDCSASRARDLIDELDRTGRITVMRTVSGTRLLAWPDVERIALERAARRAAVRGVGA